MANLDLDIDLVFWDQNVSSPQTLEGTARSAPGEPFPVDEARASRSHWIQQLSLCFAKAFLSESSLLFLLRLTRDSALSLSILSFSLNSLFLSLSSNNWWLGLVGQFKPKKLSADIKADISYEEEWDLQVFKDTARHIVDKSPCSIGLWTQIAFVTSSSLLLSTERLGDKYGL